MSAHLIESAQRLGRCLVWAAAVCGGLHALSAQAAPIRYGHITWDRDLNFPTSRAVNFTVETGWRTSDFSGVSVGATVDLGLNFDFGNGQSQAMMGTVQSVFGDVFYTTSTFTHTYAAGTNGRFDVGFSGCCTLPNLQNSNAGQNFDISSEVNFAFNAPYRSPRSTTLPVLNMALGSGNQIFNLPAMVFGGEILRYVLDPLGGMPQADIFSFDGFGNLRVDTSAAGIDSGLYDLRYRLESYDPFTQRTSTSSSVYMLVNLSCTTGPSCSNPGGTPPTGVPEPGALSLALLGLAALGGTALRRRPEGGAR